VKTVVLGDRQASLLFSIAGIETRIVDNPSSAVSEIRNIRKSREYGLIIVSQKIAEWASDLIAEIRFSKSKLLIIEIPDKDGAVLPKENLNDYIRKATGIKI
jgi:V/A-type H+-transporting ATPase subunit F